MRLSIQHINKTYNKRKIPALSDFSAELTPGVYGLLGPNGAGKSTLMNLLTDNLRPDSGQILLNDASIYELGREYRSLLGYMPQQQGLYEDFTGYRFMWYIAALKGLTRKTAQERIDHLLEVVNLKQAANKKLGAYSGGMKQRILIAQALLNDPRILILDEPTAGLDPQERIRLRNFISTIAQEKIVLLATHVVSDIESIAKEVLLMKQGRLLCQKQPVDLLKLAEGKVFEFRASTQELNLMEIQRMYKVSNITAVADGVCVRVVGPVPPEQWRPISVTPTLEDVYLLLHDEAG